MTADVLAQEAEKMRRVPGIVFVDAPTGRRIARVAGTGLEVFEVVKLYREADEDWERLRAGLYWWTEPQLRAALAYAAAYPEEIDSLLRAEESFRLEDLWEKYPLTNPNRIDAILP